MPTYRPVLERFVEHIELDRNTGCWIWKASKGTKGYGQIGFVKREVIGAHRVSYWLFIGDLPKGHSHEVHHKCKRFDCVNPNHLELLSRDDHGAVHVKAECPHGHNYEKDGYYVVRHDGKTWRACKECSKAKDRRLKHAKLFRDIHIAASTG